MALIKPVGGCGDSSLRVVYDISQSRTAEYFLRLIQRGNTRSHRIFMDGITFEIGFW